METLLGKTLAELQTIAIEAGLPASLASSYVSGFTVTV